MPVKTTAKTKTKPAAPNAEPKPVAELPKLSQLQEFLCDTLGDLILRGGHPDDIHDVLMDAAYHHERKHFPRFSVECDKQYEDRLKKQADLHVAEWTDRLAKEWPEPQEAGGETPEPTGVVQRIRALVNDNLEERFRDFMLEATPEEKRLLLGVFQNFDGTSNGRADNERPELLLATAFMDEIGADERYIKLPNERIKDLVVRYVELLAEGNAKPAVVSIAREA
jgi:hypothetical protein